MNSWNPNAVWRTAMLWCAQVDAVAKVEEDEVLCGGGEARTTEGRERKKMMEKGENEKKTGRGYL